MACRSGGSGGGRAGAPRRDTSRVSVGTPASPGRAGINDYNRQREALGNLDSLVTPAQPAVPPRN